MNHSLSYKFLFFLMVPLLLSTNATAHHSRANYTKEFTEISGELVGVRWRNPHISFTVRDDDGESWVMEAGNVYMLGKSGVTRDLFAVGSRVVVAGQESIRKPRDMLAFNMLLDDGREVLILPGAEVRWSEEQVEGRDPLLSDEERLQKGGDRGLFRVWSAPQANSILRRNVLITEEAIAARTSFDHEDNYATRCEDPGMPWYMVMNPLPIELIDDTSSIRLRGTVNDMIRTIHMVDAEDPTGQPSSNMGYSMGEWDGDTLVVRTSRIDFPYLDNVGTPQSKNVETVERFSLSEDQSRLNYQITITDPLALKEPAEIEKYWLALGETMEPFDCIEN